MNERKNSSAAPQTVLCFSQRHVSLSCIVRILGSNIFNGEDSIEDDGTKQRRKQKRPPPCKEETRCCRQCLRDSAACASAVVQALSGHMLRTRTISLPRLIVVVPTFIVIVLGRLMSHHALGHQKLSNSSPLPNTACCPTHTGEARRIACPHY